MTNNKETIDTIDKPATTTFAIIDNSKEWVRKEIEKSWVNGETISLDGDMKCDDAGQDPISHCMFDGQAL